MFSKTTWLILSTALSLTLFPLTTAAKANNLVCSAESRINRSIPVFKTGLSAETIFFVYPALYGLNTKLVFNRPNRPLSPYVGVDVATNSWGIDRFGANAYYFGVSTGNEWTKTYGNGIKLSPSLGMHVGVININAFFDYDRYDYSSLTPLLGVSFISELSFGRDRFYSYLYMGLRLSYPFGSLIVPTLPLGLGLAF
jgi:hypothetical protein